MATTDMVKEEGALQDNVIKPIDEYLKNKDPKLADYVKKIGLDSSKKEDLDLLEKAMGGDSAAEDTLCKKAGCTGVAEAEDDEKIDDLEIDGEQPTEDEPEAGTEEGEPAVDGEEPTGDEENPDELDYNDENVTALDIIKSMTQKILSAMGEDAEGLEDELNPEGEPEGTEDGETPELGDNTDLDELLPTGSEEDEDIK